MTSQFYFNSFLFQGTEETVRVVSMDKDFHVDCFICEVNIFKINIMFKIIKKNLIKIISFRNVECN